MESEAKDQTPPETAVDISSEKDGGILKEIIREGDGQLGPSSGHTVFVHYVGTLTSGEKFDSSRDRGERFEFQLGKGNVIKGWDVGVATMTRGELARLWCKPEYAYGKTGSPPKIPPNATLIFEVELFDWKGEDITPKKDGGITKLAVTEGEGYKTPIDEALVHIHYTGRYNGTVFEEKEVEFEVGEAKEKGLLSSFDIIAKSMKKGEISKFDVQPKYAYGVDGNPELKIPASSSIQLQVEMKDFEKVKESWEMDPKEKIEQSALAKSKGTTFFKEHNYKKAVANYLKITKFLEFEKYSEEEDQKVRDSLVLAAFLNLAMCYLKMEECLLAVEQCDKALDLDSSNVKALFRRGEARFQKSEFEEARIDFEAVVQLEPENKAARNKVTLCNQRIKEFKDKQKRIYGGMFSKFAEQDAKKERKADPGTKDSASEEGDLSKTENGETKSSENKEESVEA